MIFTQLNYIFFFNLIKSFWYVTENIKTVNFWLEELYMDEMLWKHTIVDSWHLSPAEFDSLSHDH